MGKFNGTQHLVISKKMVYIAMISFDLIIDFEARSFPEVWRLTLRELIVQ